MYFCENKFHKSLGLEHKTCCTVYSSILHCILIIQYVADLIVIPGLDEDLEVQKEMAAHAFKFKAFRCFHLAQSYVANNKWPEAMALYDRTLDHVSKAVSHYREWAGANAQVK